MEIARGAEAVISREESSVCKERIKKSYRLAEIDERLRVQRTRAEASLLRSALRAGISVPRIESVGRYDIKMEFLAGRNVKDILNAGNCKEICEKIAAAVAKLHNNNIVHGDLTTSNMIEHKGNVYFIDFGLGFQSHRPEDKANDIFLFHEALESTHFSFLNMAWEAFIFVYEKDCDEAEKVIKALRKIEKRRRYTVKSD